jgi:2-iminoacetate synthase ThiH
MFSKCQLAADLEYNLQYEKTIIPKLQYRMGNPEKLATLGTNKHKPKTNKTKKNTISVGHFFFLYNHNECIVLCLYCIIKERNVVYFVSSVKAASY